MCLIPKAQDEKWKTIITYQPAITYAQNFVSLYDVLYFVLISSNVYLLQFEKIRSFGEEEDEQEKMEEEKVKEMDFYHLCTTQTEK